MSKDKNAGTPSSQRGEEPPPYTPPAAQTLAARESRSTEAQCLPLIVSVEYNRPLYLRATAGGGKIERSGPSRTVATDAILLAPNATYHSMLSVLRFRAERKFCSLASSCGIQSAEKLWFTPRREDERGKFEVDEGNWEAVRALLEEGKGDLRLVVEDLPRGWEVDPKMAEKARAEGDGKGFSRWDLGASKSSGKEGARRGKGKGVPKAVAGASSVVPLQSKDRVKAAPRGGTAAEWAVAKSEGKRRAESTKETEKEKEKEKKGGSCCVM